MTISALPSQLGSGLASQSTQTNANADGTASVGAQLLAAIAQIGANNSTATGPLAGTLVSLGSQGTGSSGAAPLTYNAQGLIDLLQAENALNDPLLQQMGSAPGQESTQAGDPLLQSLGLGSNSSASDQSSALLTELESAQASAASTNSNSTGAGATVPSSSAMSTLAQLIQSDPTLAAAFLTSQAGGGNVDTSN